MRKFLEKVNRYLSGRYLRFDGLNIGLTVFYLITSLLCGFLRGKMAVYLTLRLLGAATAIAVYLTLRLLGAAAAIYVFFRLLSKAIWVRDKENRVFMRVVRHIGKSVRLTFNRIRYIKTNVFRKCPDCKAVIRLPNKRGRHSVRCPSCGKRFGVRIIL